MADAVLSCWFGEIRPRQWFGKDRRLRDRFPDQQTRPELTSEPVWP